MRYLRCRRIWKVKGTNLRRQWITRSNSCSKSSRREMKWKIAWKRTYQWQKSTCVNKLSKTSFNRTSEYLISPIKMWSSSCQSLTRVTLIWKWKKKKRNRHYNVMIWRNIKIVWAKSKMWMKSLKCHSILIIIVRKYNNRSSDNASITI